MIDPRRAAGWGFLPTTPGRRPRYPRILGSGRVADWLYCSLASFISSMTVASYSPQSQIPCAPADVHRRKCVQVRRRNRPGRSPVIWSPWTTSRPATVTAASPTGCWQGFSNVAVSLKVAGSKSTASPCWPTWTTAAVAETQSGGAGGRHLADGLLQREGLQLPDEAPDDAWERCRRPWDAACRSAAPRRSRSWRRAGSRSARRSPRSSSRR